VHIVLELKDAMPVGRCGSAAIVALKTRPGRQADAADLKV